MTVPNVVELWTHIYGEQPGLLSLFSGMRPEPGSNKLDDPHTAYFEWPGERDRAQMWILREAGAGRETYHCAHLLTDRRRVKDKAAPVRALWVDGDGAKVLPGMPSPTAVVESSPGREQFYWRLSGPAAPKLGELLNLRLAYAMGADKSGWDLTQLLRPAGTPNFKYANTPLVRILELRDEYHDPVELDRLLPPLPREETKRVARVPRPKLLGVTPDLSQLSLKMQDLIRHGNRGEYLSRSEADMAACVAMLGAGYSEAEVWVVMTDPTNGISEKFLEKERQGAQYLGLTISKALAHAQDSLRVGRRKAYARRKGAVSVG